VEQIWPDNHGFVTRLYGQAAVNALRSVHDGVAASYAPHSHHASARSAVVACAVGHFKIVAATQAKCRHCDEMAGESKR
jgi:hypothetical protein